jgi:hypothetical protein
MCLQVSYKKKNMEKKNFFCIFMSLEKGVRYGSVSQRYGSLTLVFIIANLLFPPQDCVHQQAGQAGGGRIHDGDVNDATAGDCAASPPDPAGPGNRVQCVHPQSEKCIPEPTFFRSGSYLQIHSESASFLSNLDRSDPFKVILDPDSMFHVIFSSLRRKDLFQILIQPSLLAWVKLGALIILEQDLIFRLRLSSESFRIRIP